MRERCQEAQPVQTAAHIRKHTRNIRHPECQPAPLAQPDFIHAIFAQLAGECSSKIQMQALKKANGLRRPLLIKNGFVESSQCPHCFPRTLRQPAPAIPNAPTASNAIAEGSGAVTKVGENTGELVPGWF
jgi:hypothetical protein